jgi:tryptophan synthase alpha chain
MSQRYEKRFAELAEARKKAFIPFTLLGWPDKEACFSQICAMIDAGASALELGIPFSDALADGPVIQRAAHEALQAGFKMDDAFALLERIRGRDQSIPIGLLVYYNLVLACQPDRFFERCAKSGVDAVLIADLPIENVLEVKPSAQRHSVELIYLVSPVTTPSRLDLICANAGAFLYLISRLGVTGTDKRDEEKDAQLKALVENVRQRSKLPVCAGFGISKPEHARNMFKVGVDGVIAGSRVIEIIGAAKSSEDACQKLTSYLKDMLDVCQSSGAACL